MCKITSYQTFKEKAQQKSSAFRTTRDQLLEVKNQKYISSFFLKQKQITKGFYGMSKTARNSKRELSFDSEKIIGAGFHSSHNQRATLFRNECKQT